MIHAYYLIKSVCIVLSTEIRCDWQREVAAADKDSMLVMTVLSRGRTLKLPQKPFRIVIACNILFCIDAIDRLKDE